MQKKNIYILLAVALIVAGGIYTYQFSPGKGVLPQTINTNEETARAAAEKLTLEVKIAKDVYALEEPFSGEYYMKYDGTPFEGIILYCSEADGLDKGCAIIKGTIQDVDFSVEGKNDPLKAVMSAFAVDEELGRMPASSFDKPGTYTFSVAVFDCFYVEKGLNADNCGGENIDPARLAESVQPVKWASKEIKVETK